MLNKGKKRSAALLSFALLFSSMPSAIWQPLSVWAQSEEQRENNQIVAAGYLSVSADDRLNELAKEVYGENGSWEIPVSGSRPKTLYAAFKLDPADSEKESYTITFTKGENSCARTIQAKEGGLVYFALDEQEQDGGTLPVDDLKGTYTVTLSKEGETTPLATAEFDMYRMVMQAGDGCTGPDRIVYLDDLGLERAMSARPHEYEFTGDCNTWNENKVEKEGYDVTVTISARYEENADSQQTIIPAPCEHGSFTLSNLKAKPGDNVKISPVADQGYWTDQVNAIDSKGNPISIRE